MIGAFVGIAIGYVLWNYLPKWIELNSKKSREIFRVICTILGILMILGGVFSILNRLGHLF